MAIWQFDFNIIPKENSEEHLNLNDEEILAWNHDNYPIMYPDFLERQKGWTSRIVQYGKEDETCIQFIYEGDLKEIICRLDLRSITKCMLERIMEYMQKIDGMILFYGKKYEPNIDVILALLQANKMGLPPRMLD